MEGQFSEVFMEVVSPLNCPLNCSLCLSGGPTQGHPTRGSGWAEIWSILYWPSHESYHGAVLTGRRGASFVLKDTMSLPTIVSRGQIHPDNVWFLLLPPRNRAFFWIAQVRHSEHGYHGLLQWLSSVHGQGERKATQKAREKWEVKLFDFWIQK